MSSREVKRSTRRDKSSHVERLAKSAEEAAFVGNMAEVYKITKELVYTNAKADLPVLISMETSCLLMKRSLADGENTLSLCLIMLCRLKFPLVLQPQKLFHQLEALHKLLPVNRK